MVGGALIPAGSIGGSNRHSIPSRIVECLVEVYLEQNSH